MTADDTVGLVVGVSLLVLYALMMMHMFKIVLKNDKNIKI